MSADIRIAGEIEEYTVCTGGGLFPVVDRLQTGELAVILRDIPNHATAFGGLDLYVSADGGKTWTKRSDLPDFLPDKDCRNPAFGVLSDGTLAVGLAGFDYRPSPREFKYYFTRSTDGGFAWEPYQELSFPTGMKEGSPYGKIVEQPNGTALMPVYAEPESYILRSTDSGRSWGNYSLIAGDNYSETAVLALDDNHIIAVMRSRQANGVYGTGEALFQTHSEDGGATWSTPQRLTLDQQHPADLIRLQDGSLLLTYGNRIDGNRIVEANLAEGEHAVDRDRIESRNGAKILVSRDNGRTWGPEGGLTIYEGCISDDCGYPSSVQLDDGTIVSVFYEETVRRKDFRAVALRYKLTTA